MEFGDIIQRLDELLAHTPALTKEQLAKLHYKLRLEMNFHSNHMEGNTLTLEETRSVMIDNLEIHNKPLKHILEIQGHDKIMQQIFSATAGDLRVTESFVKELHTGIMSELENKEMAAKIGKWKSQDNYLLNYKGERQDFTPAEDVPKEINTLINWLDNQLYQPLAKGKQPLKHPVLIAAEFHLRFVGIHPFYDGNGRMARLLSSVILLASEYPIVLIKSEMREAYIKHLAHAQAYEEDPKAFYKFIAQRVLDTQELIAKAAKGESLEEPGDLDKKLNYLDAIIDQGQPSISWTPLISQKLWATRIRDLMIEVLKVTSKFTKYYELVSHWLEVSGAVTEFIPNGIEEEVIRTLEYERPEAFQAISKIEYWAKFGPLTKAQSNQGHNYRFIILMDDDKLRIWVESLTSPTGSIIRTDLLNFLYENPLSQKEIDDTLIHWGNILYQGLQQHIAEAGIGNAKSN